MEHSVIDNAPWDHIDEQVRGIVKRQMEREQEQAEKAAMFDVLYSLGYTEFKRIWLKSNNSTEFVDNVRAAGQAARGTA